MFRIDTTALLTDTNVVVVAFDCFVQHLLTDLDVALVPEILMMKVPTRCTVHLSVLAQISICSKYIYLKYCYHEQEIVDISITMQLRKRLDSEGCVCPGYRFECRK